MSYLVFILLNLFYQIRFMNNENLGNISNLREFNSSQQYVLFIIIQCVGVLV